MDYANTPLTFEEVGTQIWVVRNIEDRKTKIDKLVDLIVFTPRGSFSGDPDFGFEYWNHEYSNVSDKHFNENLSGRDYYAGEGTKARCQESIRQSLMTYAPELKDVRVTMTIGPADSDRQGRRKVLSRHMVTVEVSGNFDDGLATKTPYHHPVVFLIEPHAKRINI